MYAAPFSLGRLMGDMKDELSRLGGGPENKVLCVYCMYVGDSWVTDGP